MENKIPKFMFDHIVQIAKAIGRNEQILAGGYAGIHELVRADEGKKAAERELKFLEENYSE